MESSVSIGCLFLGAPHPTARTGSRVWHWSRDPPVWKGPMAHSENRVRPPRSVRSMLRRMGQRDGRICRCASRQSKLCGLSKAGRLGRFEYELDRDADNSPRLYIPAELLPRDWDGYASLLVVLVDIQAAATRACLIRHILESDDYSVRDSQLARLVVPETPLCVRTHSLVNHFTHTCNCELCAFALAYCPLTQNDDCTNPPCTHGALVDYGRSTWSTLELAELESRSNVAAESKVKQLALRDWTQIRERDIDRLSKPTVMSWLDALFGVPLLQANDERIQSLTSRIQPECWANTWTCIADEDLLSLIDNTDTIRIGDKVYVPLRLGTARRLLYQLLLVLRSVND